MSLNTVSAIVRLVRKLCTVMLTLSRTRIVWPGLRLIKYNKLITLITSVIIGSGAVIFVQCIMCYIGGFRVLLLLLITQVTLN